MLRDRRPRDGRESRGDLDHRKLPRTDEPEDLAPMRLGDRSEGEVRNQRVYSRKGCGLPDSANAFSRPTICPQV